MINIIFSVILTFGILGCSATVKFGGEAEKSTLIIQDKEVTPFKGQYLTDLQQAFPEHKVNQLNLMTQSDGAKLQGLFLDNPHSQDVIFYIPGSGMKIINDALQVFTELSQLNKDVVFFDRRGTGASTGKATVENLMSDAVEQVAFIRHTFTPEQVIVHGFSLGSFVAGQLVKSTPVDALVLQGSASNIDDWSKAVIPWYISFIDFDFDFEADFSQIDNEKVVTDFYHGPLFIIGGEDDTTVPSTLSEQLFNASKSKNKKLMLVENAGHREMLKNPNEINSYKVFLASF